MRVLLISHEFTVTGASRTLFRAAIHLQGQGHAITVLPCMTTDGPMRGRYAAAGIPIVAAVTAAEYDVMIANTICAAPFVVHLAAFVRTVWWIHEAEIGLLLLLEHREWIAAFQLATAVIYDMAFQHEVFRSFTHTLDRMKFHAIPIGVEVDAAALRRDRVDARTRALRVVQVGTIEPRKRPGDLILAVAGSGLDMECVLCGHYYDLDAAARAVVDGDPARFRLLLDLADHDEVLAWTESADIVCLASASETQALAVYEAALLARPLLLTDLACYRDVFAHGRDCLLYPVGNRAMLTGSLRLLAADPALRDALGEAARRTARRFSVAGFLARFDAVLRDVMAA